MALVGGMACPPHRRLRSLLRARRGSRAAVSAALITLVWLSTPTCGWEITGALGCTAFLVVGGLYQVIALRAVVPRRGASSMAAAVLRLKRRQVIRPCSPLEWGRRVSLACS